MSGQIIASLAGIIIALIATILGMFFIQKKSQNCHKQSSDKGQGTSEFMLHVYYGHRYDDDQGKSSDQTIKRPNQTQTFLEIKSELRKLKAEVDEINRGNALTMQGCSNVNSGCDHRTACDDLELADYDLLNEANKTAAGYEDAEDSSEYQQKLNDIDQKLESDDRQEINEAFEDLKCLCFNNPEDVELLYRIGKAHVRLSEEQSQDVVKKHVERGIEVLTTALNLHKKHAEVHKWYGILLGLRAQFQPLRQKANDGMLFKMHCDLACALKPDDPFLHHILGRFDFEIASLGWIKRKTTGAFMGDTLASSYKDALNRFMTAERLADQKHASVKEKIENKKMIANTLVALDRKAEAEKWFKQVEHLELVDDRSKKAICEKS